ncbi:PqqD family protein [Methylobacterium tardum]|uniref:PqqD family protein n=1 Tax=Methylobacterium tardum TaxID=374432 RepID=UPI003570AD4E
MPSSQSNSQDEWSHSHGSKNDERCGSRQHACVRFIRSPTAVYSCFRGGVSIVNLSTGRYYRLEEIGFCIWKILARPLTIKEIRVGVIADCAMEPNVADTTIVAFLNSLTEAGLVVAT